MRKVRRILALTLLLTAPPLAARELHWRELAVDAKLESDGTLAVRETQAMVFSGDWNGGERIFRLGLGQEAAVDAISRRDPATGEWRPLTRGSLDRVDNWNWTDAKTVRWRSRRPSDPAFDGTEIDYRIDYRLTGVLRRSADVWVIDHDFGLPYRDGEIERFTLDFELAPEWSAPERMPRHAEESNVPPGRSFVVTADLTYLGAGQPAHAGPREIPLPVRAGGLAALAAGVAALFAWAIGRERSLGRFAPLPAVDTIDRAWLDSNLFALPPEEVGAAWDETVGAAEVAALLARLQLEKRISSRVETSGFLFFKSQNLHLKLEAPRSQFSPTERKLIDGLFFSGRDEVDTSSLRQHYKTSGFDPASKIRDLLVAQVGRRKPAGSRPRPARTASVLLVLGGLAGLLVSGLVVAPRGPAAVVLGAILLALWIPGGAGAYVLRDRVTGFRGNAIAIVVSLVLALGTLWIFGLLPVASTAAFLSGLVLELGLARTMATSMQTRQGAERIAWRRQLARARAWFEAELAKPQPHLDDSWVPYVLAFGLAAEMDRWFRAFGGAAASTSVGRMGSSNWSGSGSGGVAGGGWTGGGGAFGGAGASARWAAAATAMSAGVAAASSSSGGGGGGGGGGGSSGGGGGGGW